MSSPTSRRSWKERLRVWHVGPRHAGAHQKQKDDALQLADLMLQIDTDASGNVDICEFVAALEDEHIRLLFNSLEIGANEACRLFEALDLNEDGLGDVSEFIDGCLRIKGLCNSYDMHVLFLDLNRRLRWHL